MSRTNCPNCGAPITHYYNYNCEYCGTFLNNLENTPKFLENKEITHLKVDIMQSYITFGYEVVVTGIATDSFSYCKEYDSNGLMVIDNSSNSEKIGFKFLLKRKDIAYKNFDETVNIIRKYIPPEFQEYEDYIIKNIIIKAIGYRFVIDGRWR